MAFGFNCLELDGVTPQNIAGNSTPAFLREIPGGCRCFFQARATGDVAPYVSTSSTRAATSAGLAAATSEFFGVDFLENAPGPAPTVTLNAAGEIAQLAPLPASLLAAGVVAAVRVTYSGGAYVDVQGTLASVTAALAAGGSSSGIVGPLATVYVEPPAPAGRGNDATGVRGDAARPFATLTGALAVMQSGDTISLAAGSYAPPSGPIPAPLTSGAIVAPSGPGSTVIDGTGTGLACLDFSSSAARVQWGLEGFRLNNTGGVALRADGSAAPAGQFFQNGALSLDLVVLEAGSVELRYLGTLAAVRVILVTPDTVKVDTCDTVFFLQLLAFGGGPLLISADCDDPLNPAGPGTQLGPARFAGDCVLAAGTIVCEGQGGVYAAPGSQLPAVTANALTVSVGGFVSSWTMLGALSSLDLAGAGSKMPDAQNFIDLRGATIAGSCALACGPGATSTVRVEAGGASFGGSVSIGEACLANLRTASFSGGILASLTTPGSSGRVIPPTFAVTPELVVAPPGVSSFALPFRLDAPSYAVALDYSAAGDGPGAVVIRGTTSFDVESLSNTPTGTVAAIVSYYGA